MSRRAVPNHPHDPAHSLISTPPRGHTAPTYHPVPKISYSSPPSYATHPAAHIVDYTRTRALPTPPASSASSPVAILEAHAHAHAEDPWREKVVFEGEAHVEDLYHNPSRVHLEYDESSRIVSSRSRAGMDLGTSSIEGSWRMEGSGHGHGFGSGHGVGFGSASGSGLSFESSGGGMGGMEGVGRRGKASGIETHITAVSEGVGMGTGSGMGVGSGLGFGGSGGSGGSGLGWAVPSTYAPASTGADPLLGSNTPEGDLRLTPKDKGKERVREDGIMAVKVLADVLDTSKGRDKVLKCAQYSIRTYLYLLSLLAAVRPLSPWFTANAKRMRIAQSGLSLTRKCLLLLNPLHPLSHLLSSEPTSAPKMLRHLIDLASALSDDVFCLSRLGLVSRRTGKWADKWANRLWLLTTLMALYTLHVRTIPSLRRRLPSDAATGGTIVHPSRPERESRKALSDAEWTNRKLLADLVFVSYDVFHLTRFEEPVKCIAGLVAGLISTNKLYESHWRASLGKG
ncbi:hypothetical protein JCM24511_03683 [Saitozyma sp. JCM 24511]|nr:hypothetical protein JCM24511_03683 [Saitozyma sp. JCM 24511]